MHLAPRLSSPHSLILLVAALIAGPFAAATPTVTNLDGDVLNYVENQNPKTTPAFIDVGGNATVTMGITAGVSKLQYQIVGGNSAADSLDFGNSGTGSGQVIVGYTDNGSGSYGFFAKVSGVVVGTLDSATSTITFNASATSATVTTLVRNLRYNNWAPYVPAPTRTVRLIFTETAGQTYTANTTVNVTAVNDAPQFIGAGFASTDFGNTIGNYGVGQAIAQQPDGKYIVLFEVGDKDWNAHLAVARFNPDGTLDSTFGTAGWYHSAGVTPNTNNNTKGLLLRSDAGQAGKILISTSDYDATNANSLLFLQLTAAGVPDTSFGTGGLCRINSPEGSSSEEVCAIAQQADGKIVAVGSFYTSDSHNISIALWRLLPDGSGLDPTFGTNGCTQALINNSYSYGLRLLIQPDAKIVVGGLVPGANTTTDSWDIGVRRYNADGSLDTTFGTAGMAQLDYADTHESRTLIARQALGANAGKIIVVANYHIPLSAPYYTNNLIVTRLNPDGTIDTSFGTAGWTVLDVANNQEDNPAALTLDAADRILIAGSMGGSAALVRLTAEGTLDPSLNTTGILSLRSMGGTPSISGISVDAGGKILLTGGVEDFENNPLTDYPNTFGLVARLHSDGSADAMGSSPFIPGGAAVVIDPDIQIFDGELASGNYAGATLTLRRHGGTDASDVFASTGTLSLTSNSFVVGGVTIGTLTNSAGTLAVTFNSNATTARLISAFRQITYRNTAATPPPAVQLDWSFNDGNTSAAQGTGGALTTVGVTVVDIAIPRLHAITPSSGSETGGTSVALNGRYFDNAATVRFGSTAAGLTFNNTTSLTTVSPAGTGTVHIGVTTANGTSPQTTVDQFAYIPLASFEDWAAASFTAAELANTAISGTTADPDGAGISNLIRYACGLPARGRVAAPSTATFNTATNAATATFSFPMRASADDLLYEVQTSNDLATWATAETYSTTGTARTVAALVSAPTGATRFFVRLRVTQAP